ncbi:hypothetical protein C1H46_018247 [Malus baccata]|uniref:AAA-type ATPase N-terminal domain-containing protein n=1 Tax=Malus baccata TaxID=106549 RepID=A0A540MBI2_MALBA|nr:hypothetical protein C1H46_018247 [Malus baccata]
MALEEFPTSKRPSWSPVPAYAVEEFTKGGVPNEMFKAVNVYVDKRLSCPTLRIKVSNNTNIIKNNEFESHQKLDPAANKLLQVITVDGNSQELVDSFQGVGVMWALVSSKLPCSCDGQVREQRHFELSFRDGFVGDVNMFLNYYLNHILQKYQKIKAKNEQKYQKINAEPNDVCMGITMSLFCLFLVAFGFLICRATSNIK